MNSKVKLLCICCTSAGITLPGLVSGEVKSLSSNELTETYIKDSTIIVTPKNETPVVEQQTYSSLTIAPVENNDADLDQLEHAQLHNEGSLTSFELDEETLRNASVNSVFTPTQEVDIPTYEERTTQEVADILGDERYRVPEGDFNYSYIGTEGNSDLGLSRTGDKLTFSIGAPAGVPNPIQIPEALQEGPIDIVPREGGGFDLTINIPEY